MKCLCALLLLVAAAASLNISNRIVGGQPTTIQHHPYQVLLKEDDNFFFCGGVLVKPNKVLTAAHCVLRFITPSMVVQAGSSDYRHGTTIATRSFKAHPEYRRDTKVCDIAVLTLVSSFQLGATISIIGLVGIGKKAQPGEMMTITGWGSTQFAGDFPPTTLHAIRLPVIGNVPCGIAYNDDPRPPHITDVSFCAGDGSKGPYVGDSGSPVVNENKQLAGVVSWGTNKEHTKLRPSVVTDLCHAVVRRFVDDNL